MVYSFILENKEAFKIIFAAIITLVCILIVFRTHKLFNISLHPGIRYFRNAFFFYGFAFFVRYFLSFLVGNSVAVPLFEFFVIMAGFFLVYSLTWKKIGGRDFQSSLLNSRIVLFYSLAIILVLLDILWNTLNFMFISQIILFIIASSISYINSREKDKTNFLKFYFVAMILMLVAWILNFFTYILFNGETYVLVSVYILNAIFFLLLLFGVIKATKK